MGFLGKAFIAGIVVDAAKKIKDTVSKNKNRKDGNEYIKVSNFIYDLIGGNYKDAKETIEGYGFSNISCVAKKDLKRNLKKGIFFKEKNEYENGEVEEISINGEVDFDKNDQFLPSAKVTIVYHTFSEVVGEKKSEYINISSFIDDLFGANYKYSKEVLNGYGFTNVSFVAIRDLKKGLKKGGLFRETNDYEDGEVEEISINGEVDFDKIYNFLPDSRVVIKYHTYESSVIESSKLYAKCLNCKANFEYSKNKPVCPYCGEPVANNDNGSNVKRKANEEIEEDEYMNDIDWYCDECGAYMNRQRGFTTRSGMWKCVICGYNNDVTEDNIVWE